MTLIVVPLQTVMLGPSTHVSPKTNLVTENTILDIFVFQEFAFSAIIIKQHHGRVTILYFSVYDACFIQFTGTYAYQSNIQIDTTEISK
jgi:hypothetical protein